MWKNKRNLILAVLALIALGWFFFKPKHAGNAEQATREVQARMGDIEKSVLATGAVQPQNRLEMKPPVSGRVDKVLVTEGQAVKAGETVALMSSTERAALLDSAKSKGEKEMSYWEDIYKPIPLIAPIDGNVIVSKMQPGQAVAQTDPIVVLSDRLIVQAQVDETDIGGIEEGQEAEITLDAYPEIRVDAKVGHIYHESEVVNNVTIYKVDVLPAEVPGVFRSGMSANVRIVEQSKQNVLTLPSEAVKRGPDGESFALVREKNGQKTREQAIETGLSDDTNTEIVSGLQEGDTAVIISKKYIPSKTSTGASNPFMPQSGTRRQSGSSQGR